MCPVFFCSQSDNLFFLLLWSTLRISVSLRQILFLSRDVPSHASRSIHVANPHQKQSPKGFWATDFTTFFVGFWNAAEKFPGVSKFRLLDWKKMKIRRQESPEVNDGAFVWVMLSWRLVSSGRQKKDRTFSHWRRNNSFYVDIVVENCDSIYRRRGSNIKDPDTLI